jgi:hypothetical protein
VHGREQEYIKGFGAKTEGKKQLERPRHTWKDVRIDLKSGWICKLQTLLNTVMECWVSYNVWSF